MVRKWGHTLQFNFEKIRAKTPLALLGLNGPSSIPGCQGQQCSHSTIDRRELNRRLAKGFCWSKETLTCWWWLSDLERWVHLSGRSISHSRQNVTAPASLINSPRESLAGPRPARRVTRHHQHILTAYIPKNAWDLRNERIGSIPVSWSIQHSLWKVEDHCILAITRLKIPIR